MKNYRKLFLIVLGTVFIIISFLIPQLTAHQTTAKVRAKISLAINNGYLEEKGFTKTTSGISDTIYEWRADDLIYRYYTDDSQVFGSYQKSIGQYILIIIRCYDSNRYTIALTNSVENSHHTAELDSSLNPVSDSAFFDNCVPVEIVNNEDSYRKILQHISADNIKTAACEYEQFTSSIFTYNEVYQ